MRWTLALGLRVSLPCGLQPMLPASRDVLVDTTLQWCLKHTVSSPQPASGFSETRRFQTRPELPVVSPACGVHDLISSSALLTFLSLSFHIQPINSLNWVTFLAEDCSPEGGMEPRPPPGPRPGPNSMPISVLPASAVILDFRGAAF